MKAYIFQAALLCEFCTGLHKATAVKPDHVDEADESSYDSDEWPKGPYSDGGGEADCPQHCDACGTFLKNPLTEEGSTYVKAAWRRYTTEGSGNANVRRDWAEEYVNEWTEFAEEFEEYESRFKQLVWGR